MGVSDRDYMQGHKGSQGARFGLTPETLIWWIIGLNAAIFLLPAFTPWGYVHTPLGGYRLGGYSSEAFLRGEFWTLLTYPVVHSHLLHLGLNMLALWFLGRAVAQALGVVAFLGLYLAGGVAGALFETAIRAMCLQHTSIIGSNAAVAAVLAVFVALKPQASLQVIPLPFSVRARTLLWVFLALNGCFGLMTLFQAGDPGAAYLAYCGGALYGLAHAKYFLPRSRAARPSRPKPKAPAVKYTTRSHDPKIIDAQFTESADVDYNEVLDKINRSGIGSLTPRERRILEQASEKLSRDKP